MRVFALIFGFLFLVTGVAGFVPGLIWPDPDQPLAVEALHGQLFATFPVNLAHDLVHVAFGIWGIIAYRSFGQAQLYARSVAIIYALLAVAGFIPGLNTLFGLAPIGGADIGLHAFLALVAAIFGWVYRTPQAVGPARAPR